MVAKSSWTRPSATARNGVSGSPRLRGTSSSSLMAGPVAVAMSGGVDSSVAAALLKQAGRDVVGLTLQVWPRSAADRDRHHGCCSLDAVEDARRVAASLAIPYYVL